MQLPSFTDLNSQTIPDQLATMLQDFKQAIVLLLQQEQSVGSILNLLDEQAHALERFWSPCAHLKNVLGSEPWRACYQKCLPLLTDYDTFVHQNFSLYQALQRTDKEPLTIAQCKMRENFLLDCHLSGIDLELSKKQRVEHIFKRLDELSQLFENHIVDSQEKFKFVTQDLQDLSGLPEHVIANAKQDDGSYALLLNQPTYTAVVTYAENRDLRKLFFKAYHTRAADNNAYDAHQFDNTVLIQEILTLRQELAHLIGKKNYLEYSLTKKMAKSPDRVLSFIQDLFKTVVPVAQRDIETVTVYAKACGFVEELQAWDIPYFVNLRQKELFFIDQEALRTYFPLKHVMQALNQLLQSLYGVFLEKVTDGDYWHPEVECFYLKQNHEVIGALYCDWFSRVGKRGGAWMDTLQTHTAKFLPIATLTCNFARPAPQQESGLTHDELTTLLHELGHCLHHLLSEVDLYSVSGIHGVEWDAVELPSQWMENWAWQRDWIKVFSAHQQTGLPLPEEQFQQLLKLKNDLVGLFLLRQLIFAQYDVSIHQQPPPQNAVQVFQQYFGLLQQYAVWPLDPEQRFSQTFSHIFAGGYDAGYYSYLWAEVLAADVFAWFEQHLPDVSECGQAFRACILSRGGSIPALQAFVDLMDREPSSQALLKSYGLVS